VGRYLAVNIRRLLLAAAHMNITSSFCIFSPAFIEIL